MEALLELGTDVVTLWDSPYFLGLDRAMVSLGPLSGERYCPYRCKFCYVQGPFPKYASAPVDEIVTWLKQRRNKYSIVYISGDTDSFAHPRTAEGLTLLEALLPLQVDVLFTTRYVFTERELERLGSVTVAYRARNLLLIGCISISQLHHPQLEPPPIQDAVRRIQVMENMRTLGVVSVLTIRPFIPSVPAAEYCEIAALGVHSADVVVGGDLYLDSQGAIQRSIIAAQARAATYETELPHLGPLDFSLSTNEWHTLTHPKAAAQVKSVCEAAGKPFFMRSAGAVAWVRQRRSTFLDR